MALRLQAVVFDVSDASAVASFWAALLNRQVLAEPGGAFVPGDGRQVGLRFVTSDSVQIGPRRLHLHLTSTDLEHQQRTVESALWAGAQHLDVGQAPNEGHVVLADPGGNELCVIEPGNRWLAGTGLLGEVTCDGTGEVGKFWSQALRWPLVLDEDGQTAVQSPLGGTKISWDVWDGPSHREHTRSRQRFDLVTSELGAEADRLIGLGATLLTERDDHLGLADPGGDAFGLHSEQDAI